jgi:putative ABC transport system ATP-binding protein
MEGVRKSYREVERGRNAPARSVFDDLQARFERGRITALVGRSGSGKSTLLNLVSGIDLPDAGRILFDGRDVSALSERERTLHRRHTIGFVFQFFNLLPTLTVAENLLLPLQLLGRERGAARRRVGDLLERVHMRDRADDFPDQLSGGEQQRVAVARALVHEPALVLADEPTGNLDADTGREVLALLVAATRDAGHTLIVATHSSEAAGAADRVLRIQAGRLVDETGGPALRA